MTNTERVSKLRAGAVAPAVCYLEFYLHFYRYFQEKELPYSHEAYGEAFYYACERVTPVIEAGELIVGRVIGGLDAEMTAAWNGELGNFARQTAAGAGGGQDSHMSIDYPLLLTQGVEGVIAKIDAHAAQHADEAAQLFYRNARRCLEGVVLLSERYAALAEDMAKACGSADESAELYEIARICRAVPRKPAATFYEAVQSAHFMSFCVSFNPLRLCPQQFQLGHPDRYLLPYYEADMASGRINRERAQLLMDCLAIQINHRVPAGLSSGYMLGGRDESGAVVANEVTELGLRAIDEVRLVYPAVGFCYTPDMPDKYLALSCEILSHGCSHPAIFNDDIITQGLMEYGLPREEACNYIHSTCVEITPVASSHVWVASPYTNLLAILLDVMKGAPESYEALVAAYQDRLAASIRANFEAHNAARKHRAVHSFNPLLSCFVHDCLRDGVDIEWGGGRYNWIMPSFVGMANLVDSLYAIKTLVYEEKSLTMQEYLDVLAANYEGYEALHARILNKLPKYGNDNDDVDGLFGEMTAFIISECRKHTPIHQNARLVPSVFCYVRHEQFGAQTGATPDGRLATFPLGDGSGPAQGRELCGPTASIISSTKWSHKEFIGGVAVNIKFAKKHFDGDSLAKVMALVKTYMLRGGFELQVNVIDRDTLLRARENPAAHRDLVVRIGGYSDYFVRLSPRMQQEVITRTEHEL